MIDISVSRETTAPPELVLASLRELSPERRHEFWSNVTPKYFKVHDSGAGFAELTEGTFIAGVFWERNRYDWSQPGNVSSTVVDSNVLEPGSTFELCAQAKDQGRTRVEMTLRSKFRPGPKGRTAAAVNHLGGRRLFGWYLGTVLKAVEKRHAANR
jgi:hypothetical protein